MLFIAADSLHLVGGKTTDEIQKRLLDTVTLWHLADFLKRSMTEKSLNHVTGTNKDKVLNVYLHKLCITKK